MVTGVFEILDNDQFASAIKEISRVTKKGLYVEDFFEKFPGGYPRDTLGLSFLEVGFITKKGMSFFLNHFLWINFKNQGNSGLIC